MAGSFKPSWAGTEGTWTINAQSMYYSANNLFNGTVNTTGLDLGYWYNAGDYLDITINQASNIWCYRNKEGTQAYTGQLDVYLYVNSAWVLQTYKLNGHMANTDAWALGIQNLPAGRYKFVKGANYRADGEWFIEVAGTGKLKSSIDNVVTVGDRISSAYYAPTSGAVGTFTGLGSTGENFLAEIPVGSSATPYGTFFYIYVGNDSTGKKILVADRNIQHTINWDNLNSYGITSNAGMPFIYTGDLCNGGTVRGNALNPTYAFNNVLGDPSVAGVGYGGGAGVPTGYIDYQFIVPQPICRVGIYSYYASGVEAIKDFNIVGSNTGAFAGEETLLYTGQHPNDTTTGFIYHNFTNTTPYSYIRINITSIYPGNGADNLSIVEVEMMARAVAKNYNASIRLLTGGVSNLDFNSEWDNYIVNNNLNNSIVFGDNLIWNWSGVASWTSTSSGTGSPRTIRGNATADTSSTLASATANATTGFRPVLALEPLEKYLLQDGTDIKTYKAVTNNDLTSTSLTHTLQAGSIYRGTVTSVSDKSVSSDPTSDNKTLVVSGTITNVGLVSIDFGTTKKVVKLVLKNITTYDAWKTMYIKNFKLQGSNTGGTNSDTWVDIYTGVTGSSSLGQIDTFNFSNSTGYRYYRIYVIDTWGYGTYISLSEWEMYEAPPSPWLIVGSAPVTSDMFNQAFTDVSLIASNISTLTSDNIDVLYSSPYLTSKQLRTTITPKEKLIKQTSDIDLSSITAINSITLTANTSGNGLVKVLFSTDSGANWYSKSNPVTHLSATTAIPTMTSATTPSGVAFTRGDYSSSYAGWKAFDGDQGGSDWEDIQPTPLPTWIGYQFPTAKVIGGYSISTRWGNPPKSWQFQGSNDGTNWTTLDTRTGQATMTANTYYNYTFTDPSLTAYTRFRIYITELATTVIDIGDIKMFEVIVDTPGATVTVDTSNLTTVKNSAMTVAGFNSLAKTDWTTIRGASNTLRLAYYLEQASSNDTANIDKLSINFDSVGNSEVRIYSADGLNLLQTIPNSSTTWTETGLTANTQYTRQLRGYLAGVGESKSSITASATTLDQLHAPSTLSGVAVDSKTIDWTWTDTNGTVTRFELLDEFDNIVGTTGNGVFTYRETNLRYNTTYTRKVRAIKGTDISPTKSATGATANRPNANQQITIQVSKNAWVDTNIPNNNYYLASTSIGSATAGERKALLYFDTSVLSGITVNTATLKVTTLTGSTGVGGITVRTVTGDWLENQVNANNYPTIDTSTTVNGPAMPSLNQTYSVSDVKDLIAKSGYKGLEIRPNPVVVGQYVSWKARSAADSNTIAKLVVDATVPIQPDIPVLKGLIRNNTSITWSWSAVPTATGYKLYDASGHLLQTFTTETSYTETGLTKGQSYGRYLTAINAQGESTFSTLATQTPNDLAQPTSFLGSAGDYQSIDWTWTDINGGDTVSYEITDADGNLIATTNYTTKTYRENGLRYNTSYTRRFKIIRNDGQESTPMVAVAMTANRPAPSTGTLTLQTTGVTDKYVEEGSTITGNEVDTYIGRYSGRKDRQLIKFDLSNLPVGTKINGSTFSLKAYSAQDTATNTYNLYKATSSWDMGTQWANQPSHEDNPSAVHTSNNYLGWNDWTITNLVQDWVSNPSSNYGAIIIAPDETNTTRRNYRSGKYSVTTERPKLVIDYDVLIPPQIPTNIVGNGVTDTSIKWSWDAMPTATGYRVYDTTGRLLADVSTNEYTEQWLTPHTTYVRCVTAYNTVGESQFSVNSVGVAPLVEVTNYVGTIDETNGVINYSWSDNTGTELGFRIQEIPSGLTPDPLNDPILLDSIPANIQPQGTAQTVIATIPYDPNKYEYITYVTCINSQGDPVVSNVSVLGKVPSVPTDAGTKAISSGQILWKWNNSLGLGEDGGYHVTSFTGTRDISPDESGVTQFAETGLTPKTAYSIYIQPYNRVGSGAVLQVDFTTMERPKPLFYVEANNITPYSVVYKVIKTE